MKRFLFLALVVCSFQFADAQTITMRNRIDTCLAGAAGGVTAWKPCKMSTIGKNYTFSAVGLTQTAVLRFAFTWADTATATKGGVIPFISGQTITVSVPNVDANVDTVWIKGTTNDIFRMWKF